MSARTEAMEAEGLRLERWCWESLNAATCLQETGMGSCSVGWRIVLAEHFVADDQVRSVFRSANQLEIDPIPDELASFPFDEANRFRSSQNPGSDGDRDLLNTATTQHAPVQRASAFSANLRASELSQGLAQDRYCYSPA